MSSARSLSARPPTLSHPFQVLFLLYHYFEAREFYNAIRVFIAGYVWMTGFGNFSYYYKTGDYCIGRFAQVGGRSQHGKMIISLTWPHGCPDDDALFDFQPPCSRA